MYILSSPISLEKPDISLFESASLPAPSSSAPESTSALQEPEPESAAVPQPTVKPSKSKSKKSQTAKTKIPKAAKPATPLSDSNPEQAQDAPKESGIPASVEQTVEVIVIPEEQSSQPNGQASPKSQPNKVGRANAPSLASAPARAFQPSLPDLPSPQSSGMGARKRKASHDLLVNPLNKELKIEDGADEANGSSEPQPTINQLEPPNAHAEHAKKKQNAITRTVWTLIMIFGFAGRFSYTNAREMNTNHLYRFIVVGAPLCHHACHGLPITCIPGGHVSLHFDPP